LRRIPLKILLTALTTVLVLTVGGSIGWLSYARTVQVLQQSTLELMHALQQRVSLDMTARDDKMQSVMRALAGHPGLVATTLEERLEAVPPLARVLDGAPTVISLYIGYGNGDFFLLRRLQDDADRRRFGASGGTVHLVQSIEYESGSPLAVHIEFDRQLNPLGRREAAELLAFDPRVRPWYTQALAARDYVSTEPYRFFASGLMGISVATVLPDDPTGRAVFGADIRLDGLSKMLERMRPMEGARLALFDASGQIIATDLPNSDGNQLVSLLRSTPQDSSSLHPIRDPDGTLWLGHLSPILVDGEARYQLGLLVPEAQVLGAARRLLRDQALTVLGILLVGLAVGVMFASTLSRSLRRLANTAFAVERLDFTPRPVGRSMISEVDGLAVSMSTMRDTVGRFETITRQLAQEENLEELIGQVLQSTAAIAQVDTAVLFLHQQGKIQAVAAMAGGRFLSSDHLSSLDGLRRQLGVDAALERGQVLTGTLLQSDDTASAGFEDLSGTLHTLAVPLRTRSGTRVGALVMAREHPYEPTRIRFVEHLSGFISVSLETRELIRAQKALFDAFVRLIAGAIDAKSPYTGGHCARVPELARMLAEAACSAEEEPFADFDLDAKAWEALHLAAWLHDCGKVTTPEFVVDKSTRLETLYDRIHEIRTRFEVAKREAEVSCWRSIAQGADRSHALALLDAQWRELDADFAFVAECNHGETVVSPEYRERLLGIARRTWTRTLDDRLGLGPEEAARKAQIRPAALPTEEPLLADRPEHRVAHPRPVDYPPELGITMAVPELLYDRGELHNLSTPRGTLTPEERFKINEHIIHTLIMLNELPFPEHLAHVPEMAGGHHERIDGRGYPRNLKGSEMSLVARMLAIADVFEALTAADRPYKTAKTVEQALQIMGLMAREGHIDPDLFDLFQRSGVADRYDRWLEQHAT
jgi:HD-GYP domain-containing protein (c-di-GMP phosphodiesterase class II)